MANQLAARGIDLAASKLMPGGEATTQQAPVASHEAWANRLDTTETHAADRLPPVYAIADNEDDEDEWGHAALGWGTGLLALLVITVIAAGSVNGEKTMKSAEMKWPQWSFRDGPPPANRK